MNQVPAACYGLFAPDRELLGVECFGRPGGTDVLNVCGKTNASRAIALERGACVSHAPADAASYLISRAVKLAHAEHGWEILVAFADPAAGEIGTVYQACGWDYLGQGVSHGKMRTDWRRPGEREWHTDRFLAHHGFTGKDTWRRAREAGWESRTRPAVRTFATFVVHAHATCAH